ncbi:regulatory LuxR family protein [Kribbella sp. VKM Ac-2527]|uniref:Regulatory LuxR family protein n=2 Tax=Kribbella caucasensis TaxID=2512215 RepID=A0A4R6K837_9ACTN|nr:regulatory LuxR family protein [Kribbella sp. VKM Ac-2527]
MPSSQPAALLSIAARLLPVKPPEMINELSEALGKLIPHRAVAQLSTQCAMSPVGAAGDPAIAKVITGAELAPFLGSVVAGQPWVGDAPIGGSDHPVLAIASDHTPRGSVLVFVLTPGSTVSAELIELVQALWDVVTAHFYRLTMEIEPSALQQSRAVAIAKAGIAAELSEAHTATLASLLGVLRNRQLEDVPARAMAVELALNALVELRTESQRDRSDAGEEPARRAFQRLADSLRTLLRHTSIELELDAPGNDRLLPAEVAHSARAAGRAVVLAMLRQDGVRRIRVGWRDDAGGLQVSLRDDGPGILTDDLDLGQIAERLRAQGGRVDVDAVPGWGLTIRITFKTTTPPTLGRTTTTAEPFAALGSRELEVLERLAQGHRNRTIADHLHISESTVKFHVANILTKLSVTTRTEAAALYHATATA